MTTELATIDADYSPVMPADKLKQQVATIQGVMHAVMRKDEHYGVIPGCGDKPTLLQPGAQKLALTFGFAATYHIDEKNHAGGHREYRVNCRLESRQSNSLVGEGVGCCSTMERKYRYRSESTGRPVPKQYWDTRDQALIGGSSFTTRKVGGDWIIFQQVEHDNPADHYNTCLKMAKKRAFVDATLTACAASDIFTQDIEDMEDAPVVVKPAKQSPPMTAPKEVRGQPAPASAKEGAQGGLYVTNVEEYNGNTNGKDWTKYTVALSDGTEASTFDATLAALAQECQDQGKMVDPVIKPASNPKWKPTLEDLREVIGSPVSPQQPLSPRGETVDNPVQTTIRKAESRNAGGGVVYAIDTDHGRFGTMDASIGAPLILMEGRMVNLEWVADSRGMKVTKVLDLQDAPW